MVPRGRSRGLLRGLLQLVAVMATLGALAGATSAAVGDPTLHQQTHRIPRPMDPSWLNSVTCTTNADGTIDVAYEVRGPGPSFVGTFSEIGTITLSQPISTLGSFGLVSVPIDLEATFTLTSGTTTVTATKTLADVTPAQPVEGPPHYGFCNTDAGTRIYTGYIRYEAEITTPAGTFADAGTSQMMLTSFGDPFFTTFHSFAFDTSAPGVSLSVQNGGFYTLGEPLAATYSCTEPVDGGWGVATCELEIDGSPVSSGDPIDTSTTGDHAFTLRTSDLGGNAATVAGTFSISAGSASGSPELGFLRTDWGGTGATPTVPVQTTIFGIPRGAGPYSIQQRPLSGAPGVFQLFGSEVVLSGPPAEPGSQGYQVYFTLDGSLVGTTAPEDVTVFRNGSPVPGCDQEWALGPDPCVSRREAVGDDVEVQVWTSAFSTWTFGPAPSDTSPPSISPTVQGAQGANGWYVGDVAVRWAVTDDESAIATTAGCDRIEVDGDTSGLELTCEATSAGGTASASTTLKRDATAPVVELGEHPATYRVDGQVEIACTATDATSGVDASTCPSVAPAWSYGPGTTTLVASAVDRAGNEASASTTFSVVATASSLCTVTRSLVRGSSAWAAGSNLHRAAATAVTNAACAALQVVANARSLAQRQASLAVFQWSTAALVAGGWLTSNEAAQLVGFARTL